MSFFKSNDVKKAADEQSDNIDYKINCPTPSDYELTITMRADAKLLKLIWDKSKKQILRQKGLDVRAHSPDEIQEFEAPQKYHKFIKVSITKSWRKCAKKFQKKGVILLSYDVVKCNFKLNEKKGWDITIFIEGIYTMK